MITLREDKLSERANYVISKAGNKSEFVRKAIEIHVQLLDQGLIENGKLKQLNNGIEDMDFLKNEISAIKKLVEEMTEVKKVKVLEVEESIPESNHFVEVSEQSTNDDYKKGDTEEKKDQGLFFPKRKFPTV